MCECEPENFCSATMNTKPRCEVHFLPSVKPGVSVCMHYFLHRVQPGSDRTL